MSLDPAGKSAQCRVVLGNQPVGRTPWSARDARVPPVREESIGCDHRGADQGVGGGRGRPPPLFVQLPGNGKTMRH
jgi:hypothetical protein